MVRSSSRRLLFSLSSLYLLLILAAAIAAPHIAPYSPTEQQLERRFHAPDSHNILGTDELGRDILTRIIYGSRPALVVGLVTVSIALLLGGFLDFLLAWVIMPWIVRSCFSWIACYLFQRSFWP